MSRAGTNAKSSWLSILGSAEFLSPQDSTTLAGVLDDASISVTDLKCQILYQACKSQLQGMLSEALGSTDHQRKFRWRSLQNTLWPSATAGPATGSARRKSSVMFALTSGTPASPAAYMPVALSDDLPAGKQSSAPAPDAFKKGSKNAAAAKGRASAARNDEGTMLAPSTKANQPASKTAMKDKDPKTAAADKPPGKTVPHAGARNTRSGAKAKDKTICLINRETPLTFCLNSESILVDDDHAKTAE
ncbi:hypothetical protein WJX73_007154 [Symbiochloris irregularis]|uniref:Uncharacterized protein n=1 Tax=Symbiochloris irregularis TaxID=706552 RepID=A0AAW1NWF8_9CHLO